MAINLSSLAPITTAATALSNLILVTPGSVSGYAPQNPTSADSSEPTLSQTDPSFKFHYEGEQSVSLQSDITDHYVENNTAVQDQISLKPVIITTQGYIGELNDVPPYGLQTAKLVAEKLTGISSYAPELSVTAQIAYNEAFFAYQIAASAINSAVSTWSSLSSSSTAQNVIGANGGLTKATVQNKQQQAFTVFYGYWTSRRLFTVQTPWAVFQNMAILNLRSVQDAETNVITDFEITFKQIRVAKTAFGSKLPTTFAGISAVQASAPVDQGTTSGTPGESVSTGIEQTNNPTGVK